jgi:F0F1-type ATP synthase epsilon subunit
MVEKMASVSPLTRTALPVQPPSHSQLFAPITYLFVAFGFAEVLPDRVIVLAQVAERAEEIDIARAEASKQEAEQRAVHPQVDMDFARARISMMKSLIRLQVAERARMRR